MQPQKFLKILVIGLGVAIVLALGLVVYGVARLSKAPETPVTALRDAVAVTPAKIADLQQPIGTEIAQILDYGNGRVAALLKGGMVPDRIVIIDLKSGKTESTIYVTAPDKTANP